MQNALRLPVAVRGALMPDAHQGYGLPIGGVLATENAVIPYAVGVDIACRMKLSVFDMARPRWTTARTWSRRCSSETEFGTGASSRKRADHEVMEDEGWTVTPLAARLRDRAADQLGTSGSREPLRRVRRADAAGAGPRAAPGQYLALLSHSGSRGAGAKIAGHYSKLARSCTPSCRELSYLAWLDLDHEPARSIGSDEPDGRVRVRQPRRDPRARHRPPGRRCSRASRTTTTSRGRERDGRELIVHRKGATPAAAGVLGVIPGSMAAPGFVVRGKGAPDSSTPPPTAPGGA